MLVSVPKEGRVHIRNVGSSDLQQSDRPPVCVLHGFMGSIAAWPSALWEGLGTGRTIWAIDLPGHGHSDRAHDPSRYAFDRITKDLLAVLDHLGVAQADWVGYSMGGRIALGLAVSHPSRVRRLVLESASPGLETEAERAVRRDADALLAHRLESGDLEGFVDDWMALPLFTGQRRLGPAWAQRERSRRLRNDRAALAACLRGLGTGSQPSFWARLDSVAVPTLVLTGEADLKFDALGKRMQERIPGSSRASIADTGHAVHAEAPTAWVEHVTAFLDDGPASTPRESS